MHEKRGLISWNGRPLRVALSKIEQGTEHRSWLKSQNFPTADTEQTGWQQAHKRIHRAERREKRPRPGYAQRESSLQGTNYHVYCTGSSKRSALTPCASISDHNDHQEACLARAQVLKNSGSNSPPCHLGNAEQQAAMTSMEGRHCTKC
jgi:hypothetical protein